MRTDPLLKLVCGRLPETGTDLASQPTMSRLENAQACHKEPAMQPAHTEVATIQRAYRTDIARVTAAIEKPLATVTLGDFQAFSDSLNHLAPSTKARTLSAVTSLLSFDHRLGYLTFDVGRAVRLPRLRLTLAERILEEGAVQRLLALEPDLRNRAILVLFSASGIRVSELVALRGAKLGKPDKTCHPTRPPGVSKRSALALDGRRCRPPMRRPISDRTRRW